MTTPLAVQLMFDDFSLILVLLLSLLTFSFLMLRTKRSNKSHFPPCPPKLPLIGNLHQLGSLPHRSLHALAEKYGPLMLLQLGKVPTLVVASADMAREVMKTHDLIFSSRPSSIASRVVLHDNMDVAFAPYGQHWRQVRKLCVIHLLSLKMVQSFCRAREEEAGLMIDKITQLASSTAGAMNMSKILCSYTNNVICRAVSRKIAKMKGRNELFEELMAELMDVFGRFPVGDYFPMLSWFDESFGIGVKARRNAKGWDAVLDEVIDAHVHGRKSDGQEADDFVDVLLSLQKEYALTRDQIRAILLDMFSAGTETSYVVLEWSLAELIRNSKVMHKLQEEVRGVASGKEMVAENDLSKMSYLKVVLKEALRLHPPVPLSVPRESMENCQINGYNIPRKTKVLVNLWAIGRDPKFWEAPNEFQPERFINSTIDFSGNDFQFIPFGAGRRVCPGMNFAASTIELALANLVYRFEWELPNGMAVDDLDMSDSPGFSARKNQSLHLIAKPRSC